MRSIWVAALVASAAAAQAPESPAPGPALVRGILLERDAQVTSGEFSVRAADNRVFRYSFDRKTYVEREGQLIEVRRLQSGEKVEVVSDVVPGSVLRYARTIHVLEDPPPQRTLTAGRLRSYRTPLEHAIPMGNLTFSGVVFRINGERLILHTRSGDQSLLLRKDTRYVADGAIVEAVDLKPNMRVFVRAGKDIYDQLEAYQVIWGSILDPQ